MRGGIALTARYTDGVWKGVSKLYAVGIDARDMCESWKAYKIESYVMHLE